MHMGCPFCKRIENHEYAALYGWQGERFEVVRFAPLNPVVPGHMLFVPTQHQHSSEMVGKLFEAAESYALRISKDADPAGCHNLIMNYGEHATQTIQHTHVHYVPRNPNDGLILPWTNQEKKK